jgi:hypothetical protein
MTNNNTNDYKMRYINDLKQYLEDNADKRSTLSKKYSKVISGLHYTNYGLNFISASAGITSVATLPTIFLMPLSITLGAISAGASVLSVAINKFTKKFRIKENKHREIYNLCEVKLSTVESLLNKALEDGCINSNEFQLIINEERNFRVIKESIRRNNNKTFDEEEIKEKGRSEIRDTVKKILDKI